MSAALNSIAEYLSKVGCEFPDIGLLQPADPILDAAGENLRRRIFMTIGAKGEAFCLRPEFTIPVCLDHLQSKNAQGRYAYAGKVFRQRADEAMEFTQAGMEWFGRDGADADVECISIALGALEASGASDYSLMLGDQSIFFALLEALEIPENWQRQLMRNFGDSEILQTTIEKLSGGNADDLADIPAELIELADNHSAVVDWITEKMRVDSLPLNGGRTPEAIAERLLEKLSLASTRLDPVKIDILKEFLAIQVPLNSASKTLSEFLKKQAITLETAIEKLDVVAIALSENNRARNVTYQAGFGRRLDYYTGMVFEIYQGTEARGKPVAGGGRYNNLATLLGSGETQPACGFSIWVDRLEEQGA